MYPQRHTRGQERLQIARLHLERDPVGLPSCLRDLEPPQLACICWGCGEPLGKRLWKVRAKPGGSLHHSNILLLCFVCRATYHRIAESGYATAIRYFATRKRDRLNPAILPRKIQRFRGRSRARGSGPRRLRIAEYWLQERLKDLPPDLRGLEPGALARTCWGCGWSVPSGEPGMLQRAHIVPHSDGGTWSLGNILLLCPMCHAEQDNEPGEEASMNWLRSKGQRLVSLNVACRNVCAG